MHVFETHSAKLNWREDGNPQGQPIVFANSLGSDLHIWDKLVERLPQSYRIIRYDKRGHGLSSCPSSPYSISQLTDDIEALLDYLKIKKCLFIGISIGGMIAQNLAVERPDLIKALVLSNTAAKMGDSTMWQTRIDNIIVDGMTSIADAVLQRWFTPKFLTGSEIKKWRKMFLSTPSDGYIGCCHALKEADLTTQLAQITCPTIGIVGNDDAASPPELVQNTISQIKGARLHVMNNSGHLPCIDSFDEYAKIIKAFLKEINHG